MRKRLPCERLRMHRVEARFGPLGTMRFGLCRRVRAPDGMRNGVRIQIHDTA